MISTNKTTRIIAETRGLDMSDSIQRLALLLLALTIILYLTANKFDASEIKTLILWFLSAASAETGLNKLKSVMAKKSDQ